MIPRAAFRYLLLGETPPPEVRPTMRGDHRAADQLRAWAERIRRGQRTAEVEYIVTKEPRRRRLAPETEGVAANPASDPWNMAGQTASELRLPWRLNSRRG